MNKKLICLIGVAILLVAGAASAEKAGKIQDCKYYKGWDMVQSVTAGINGQVIGGKLNKSGYCTYNVRFARVDGWLFVVEGMRTDELEWAKKSEATPKISPRTNTNPAIESLKYLDFGS